MSKVCVEEFSVNVKKINNGNSKRIEILRDDVVYYSIVIEGDNYDTTIFEQDENGVFIKILLLDGSVMYTSVYNKNGVEYMENIRHHKPKQIIQSTKHLC